MYYVDFADYINALIAQGKYKEALISCELAEAEKGGKYPEASLCKGFVLTILGRDEEAVEALEKAETDNGGKYPNASSNKGVLLSKLGRNEEALAAFEKAESDSGGKFPPATFNKGDTLLEMGKYEEALAAFEKVEIDSGGIHPNASFNKATLLSELDRNEEALAAFTKAEIDSGGKNASASYNKANLLAKLGRKEEALAAFEKAETDSDGKHFGAPNNKGYLLEQMGRYEEAILAYEKAERVGGGKHPDASNNKGKVYAILDMYEEALAAYEKAISDDGGKHPTASFNKANLCSDLDMDDEAIMAYEKAEADNGGKYPDASHNKGLCYYYSDRLGLAKESFIKAIDDEVNHYRPMAHFYLAKIYSRISDFGKAKFHVFTAFDQDSREAKIVEFILENYSNPYTKNIYQNRLDYIDVEFAARLASSEKTKAAGNRELFERLFQSTTRKEYPALESFQDLLKMSSVQFPTPISFQERLRLAYLTHFLKKQPHHTFYLIDTVMDGTFELEGIDYFFYLASAYQIGEPISELEYFIEDVEIPTDDPFHTDFNSMREAFARAIQNNQKSDPYLLNPGNLNFIPSEITLQKLQLHPWIQNALEVLVQSATNPTVEYQIPVPATVLKGMATQLLADAFNQLNTEEHANNRSWKNLLRNLKDEVIEYGDLIENIREAIREKVPHSLILTKLFQEFEAEQDENKKHNLAVVQAAVLISHHVDFLKRSLNSHSYLEVPTESLVEVIVEKLVELGISLTFFTTWGIGIALGLSKNAIKARYLKNMKTKKDELFEELISQIR